MFLLNSGSVSYFKGNENYYLDNDGDGVSNAQESNDNTNLNDPCSLIVNNQTLDTSIWDIIDCDGDGLLNYEEVDKIDDPSTPPIPLETTNPLDPCDPARGPDYLDYDSSNPIWQIFDCDDDGLVNLEEFNLGTDPYDEDTDDDNFTDFEEIACGSDPLDANETCETLNLSLNNKIKFALFPNPVQGVLHINFENLQSEIELKIFDATGKELIKERFYHSKNLIIDLPFDSGVYF